MKFGNEVYILKYLKLQKSSFQESKHIELFLLESNVTCLVTLIFCSFLLCKILFFVLRAFSKDPFSKNMTRNS